MRKAEFLRKHCTKLVRQLCQQIFDRFHRSDAGILAYFNEVLYDMTENSSADAVQSRQACFVRCCFEVINIFLGDEL